jgi:hypothetical protein
MDLCDFFCVPGLNLRHSCSPEGMPAGAIADDTAGVDVRSGSLADITAAKRYVRLVPQADIVHTSITS